MLLLFADDLALVDDTTVDLQRRLNNLEKYCEKWNMTKNMDKSNIVVLKNGGNRVVVKLQLELSQVIADAMAMSVEMHHSMNLRWQDDRFIRQGSTDPHKTYINMYGTDPDFEFIWVPDVYMTNEVPSGILDYQPTDIIRIYENGTLLLSKQLNAYSDEEMDLDWFYNPPVTFSKDYVSLVSKVSNTMTEKCEGGEIAPNGKYGYIILTEISEIV
ncbi:unnamed protein product [Mytilus edulis]|uniref:Reverse transcriptase domain-containing protein n=1 Tax=Mytilus edulis TaxID=6550 RepID=A0A8S3Q4G2_MYTED|nr:unnamed protein product [Mytilus edulis]